MFYYTYIRIVPRHDTLFWTAKGRNGLRLRSPLTEKNHPRGTARVVMVRSLGLACGKKALRLVEVFGRVDADGLDIGQSDLDLVAVLQPAQLLQALRQFERRLGQTRDLAQHVGTVGIEADVLEEGVGRQPLAPILAPDEGDGRPGEVEGEAVVVEDDLGGVGIIYRIDGLEALAEGGDLRGWVVEGLHHRTQLRGLDEGFVALNIDDDVGRSADQVEGLADAVGAALVVGSRHDGLAAKRGDGIVDALVVGGDIHAVEDRSYLLIDALDDGLAAQDGERLAREARRGEARGDDGYILHGVIT